MYSQLALERLQVLFKLTQLKGIDIEVSTKNDYESIINTAFDSSTKKVLLISISILQKYHQ